MFVHFPSKHECFTSAVWSRSSSVGICSWPVSEFLGQEPPQGVSLHCCQAVRRICFFLRWQLPVLKVSRCVNLLNHSTICHCSFISSLQKNKYTCVQLLFQILEQASLFKHFHVSALLFLLNPWVCGSLICETSTNIARLPVILNFALVLTAQILFQTSSSEKHFGSGIWQLEAVDFMASQVCFSNSWFVSTVSRAATLSHLQDGGSPSR